MAIASTAPSGILEEAEGENYGELYAIHPPQPDDQPKKEPGHIKPCYAGRAVFRPYFHFGPSNNRCGRTEIHLREEWLRGKIPLPLLKAALRGPESG